MSTHPVSKPVAAGSDAKCNQEKLNKASSPQIFLFECHFSARHSLSKRRDLSVEYFCYFKEAIAFLFV